ncbi:4-hydroxy-tetrahydrodipicolinate reductase [Pendulispora albinea]|uniref:4-hydroxy-tetrahydrodipicolinate reductase n=1 Tax=Pendulispora albinea TaxID=2741071 RepID=A0ABZ2LX99_9BACT
MMSEDTRDGAASRTRVAIVGSAGKMGQALIRLVKEDAELELVAVLDQGDPMSALGAYPGAVAIDFSTPAGTLALAETAPGAGVAIVSGTTGLDDAAVRALEAASRIVPVFTASNMSVGVHVLGVLIERAIAMLGPDFDLELIEAHHRRKVDAPSGTALTLAAIAQSARGGDPRLVHGRHPDVRAARGRDEVGIHAVRGGDVIGDHTLLLLGDGERLELTHRATNRDLFARGALRAARWVAGRGAGRYGMRDLVGE